MTNEHIILGLGAVGLVFTVWSAWQARGLDAQGRARSLWAWLANGMAEDS